LILGHRSIGPQPNSCRSELRGGEKFGPAFVISRCDPSELLELVEEALDETALAMEPSAEAEAVVAVRLCEDVD
jgi:hypothetical protein